MRSLRFCVYRARIVATFAFKQLFLKKRHTISLQMRLSEVAVEGQKDEGLLSVDTISLYVGSSFMHFCTIAFSL